MQGLKKKYSIDEFANKLSVCKETLRRWDKDNKLKAYRHPMNDYRYYTDEHLELCETLDLYFPEEKEPRNIKPLKEYTIQ